MQHDHAKRHVKFAACMPPIGFREYQEIKLPVQDISETESGPASATETFNIVDLMPSSA